MVVMFINGQKVGTIEGDDEPLIRRLVSEQATADLRNAQGVKIGTFTPHPRDPDEPTICPHQRGD